MDWIQWDTLTYAVLFLLGAVIVWEVVRGRAFKEGFTDGAVPEFFGKYFPRRYDVTPGQIDEGEGWVRNPRYFEGYVDLQGLGYKGDFCRVVEKKGAPETRMVACALAGQEGLDSLSYRSQAARSGFRFSRDDYFRDVNADGREDYGRILKVSPAPTDRWEARAVLAGLTQFKKAGGSGEDGGLTEVPDNDPPPHIKELLSFFEGVMVWYRWFDDMLDYAENTQLRIAGDAAVEETVKPTRTKGLELNRVPDIAEDTDGEKPPAEQYLKIGENARLEFENIVQLRQLRAVSVWAYFDEFTNNARIFDFGNGAGKDNVLLGIEGRGNTEGAGATAFGKLRPRPDASNAVCSATPATEVSPRTFLETTDANVNDWVCPGPGPVDSTYPEDEIQPTALPPTANLLFEIWDSQQRKMRVRVLDAIPLKRWVHIAVTTQDATSLRPTWDVYIDGKKVFTEPDGHMALKSYVTQNYIGRSNWEGVTSQYLDADERFRGALFDFRLYRLPMSAAKIAKTHAWGVERLGSKYPTTTSS